MNKEMADMTGEEMFLALMGRMDGVESGLGRLGSRIDSVESGLGRLSSRMDSVESGLGRLSSRMDSVESGLGRLGSRIDSVENGMNNLNDKINTMESNINMEIQAVRTEMEVVNKSLKQDMGFLNEKIDRIMILKDVEGIEKMRIRIDVLEQGYQTIKQNFGKRAETSRNTF